ncbi:MAG: four helix bundle protein [Ignavibacteria bacterium]
MARINRFEDLICWQKARLITRDIYKITLNGSFSKDYSLKDQIRRASNSVMLNIAEGFCRKSHKEFKHFLFVAHGSIGEIQSALYIALDQVYISNEVFQNIYNKCEENSKIISGLIKSL